MTKVGYIFNYMLPLDLWVYLEAARAVQMSPAPAHRDFSRCPGGPVHHCLYACLPACLPACLCLLVSSKQNATLVTDAVQWQWYSPHDAALITLFMLHFSSHRHATTSIYTRMNVAHTDSTHTYLSLPSLKWLPRNSRQRERYSYQFSGYNAGILGQWLVKRYYLIR